MNIYIPSIEECKKYRYVLDVYEGIPADAVRGKRGTQTSFKPGCTPWNKGQKCETISEHKKQYWARWREHNVKKVQIYTCKGFSEEERKERSIRASNRNKIQATCPHCLKVGQRNNMVRWHFDRCKFKS